jgi:hypothetical protein
MSEADSDPDSISASSDVNCDEALISVGVRRLCNQLRANDPSVLPHNYVFTPSHHLRLCSVNEWIEVFQAIKENTNVKHIRLSLSDYTKRHAEAAAEYVESSKTLQTLHIWVYDDDDVEDYQETREMVSILLRALSRNTSVTKLIITTAVAKFGSVAFQELLTCTTTLRTLEMTRSWAYAPELAEFDDVQTAAITSGFANNTTLRDLELMSWQEADLVPVLTALQDHPALQKIHFGAESSRYLPSLSGLEVLLRSQYSKVKELILEEVDASTVGFHPAMQELGRNSTVTKLKIRNSVLSLETAQQLKAVLRQNTALQSLDLSMSHLGSAGLTDIAPVLYRNTSIKALDLTRNDLDDIESANVLRELIRRNKTITTLCIAHNAFGRNAAAVRSIFEGVRSNTTLQQLDLSGCRLVDQGISLLVNALVTRNASILELDLGYNHITSVGVRTLLDDNVEAMQTLTKLCLSFNPVKCEGAQFWPMLWGATPCHLSKDSS